MARIMIVDDDNMFTIDLCYQVQRLGHNVVATAQSFEDAMSVFRQARPDLILMDISLAGKTDGIETAHALRDTRKIPIIFVSAASDEITVSRAMGEATDAYLLKPFTSRRLNDAINSALRGNLKVENKYWNSHRAGVNR